MPPFDKNILFLVIPLLFPCEKSSHIPKINVHIKSLKCPFSIGFGDNVYNKWAEGGRAFYVALSGDVIIAVHSSNQSFLLIIFILLFFHPQAFEFVEIVSRLKLGPI